MTQKFNHKSNWGSFIARLFLTAILAVALQSGVLAQAVTQTIRGIITDQQSKQPVASAIVEVIANGSKHGTVSDADGSFAVEGVPVGRVTVHISHMSYGEQWMPDVVVASGKETILNPELLEKIQEHKELVVTAQKVKVTEKQMATVSDHIFNAEDTRRYAGSRNDVARMVGNFAGVVTNNDSRNDIIIRGNAPTGLLWRVEGVDVFNPNHFGQSGATGGPVSMINNNVLDKSAFYTGAFPAQFGNATAGVFDLQLREGNVKKREFTAQMGLTGLELGVEGYFSKSSRASYLVDYRYSVPALLKELGVPMGTGNAIPKYQDLSFKIAIPTNKAGKFTLFGVGGLSNIDFKGDIKDTANFYNDPYSNLYFKSNSGVAGASHTYFLSNNTSLRTVAAVTGTQVKTIQDSLNDARDAFATYREHTNEWKYVVSETVNTKFSAKDRLTAGATADDIHFSLADSNRGDAALKQLHQEKGSTQLLQAYAQWQHRFNNAITLNTGLYAQYLTLNNTCSVEPRIGMRYQVSPSGAFSLAYGRHSQMQNLMLYFLRTQLADGSYIETNRNLGFTISDHFVAGWEQSLAGSWHYKAEVYYQALSHVPVNSYASSFSALNLGAEYGNPTEDGLVNKGTGTNYGAELTIDKPFSRGYYVMATASLFQSLYKGSDGIEHNTAYNNNYVLNVLGGKEWKVGKANAVCIDVKMTAAGGKRYTEINLPASADAHTAVYFNDQPYGQQFNDYFRTDVKLTYRRNGNRVMQEIYLDLQNVTNSQNAFRQGFDNRANVVRTQNQLGFTPSVNYRIQF